MNKVSDKGTGEIKEKNKIVIFLLCLFLGPLGIHRFAVGKIGTGILYFFTVGLFGIGWIYDIISILLGRFYVVNYEKVNEGIKIEDKKRDDESKDIRVTYNNIKEEVKSIEELEPEIEVKQLSKQEVYLKSFDGIDIYDTNKELDEKFIKSITRVKEIEYEKFMKYGGTTDKPASFVVFDLETTGLSPSNSEIIQFAAIKFECGEPIEIFNTFVKPNKNISARITSINGISDEMVKDSPGIEEVIPRFIDFAKDNVLVAHNASFDMKFLLGNMYKLRYKKPKNKVLDTLTLARQKIREYDVEKDRNRKLENYKLETLKYEFGLYELGSHEGLADCKVCAYVYLEIQGEYGGVCYTY